MLLLLLHNCILNKRYMSSIKKIVKSAGIEWLCSYLICMSRIVLLRLCALVSYLFIFHFFPMCTLCTISIITNIAIHVLRAKLSKLRAMMTSGDDTSDRILSLTVELSNYFELFFQRRYFLNCNFFNFKVNSLNFSVMRTTHGLIVRALWLW